METIDAVTRYLVWEGDEMLLEVGTNGAVRYGMCGVPVGTRGTSGARAAPLPGWLSGMDWDMAKVYLPFLSLLKGED